MHLRLSVVCALSVFAVSGANAQVSAVVTGSTVDVKLTPGPAPGGTYHYSGVNIDGTNNDLSPSGASYTSRAEVEGPEILFVNGNVTAGSYASVTSRTSLDVTFTNSGPAAVDAMLRSTLLPAGFGFFVGSAACAAGPVTGCSEAVGAPGFANFPYNGGIATGPLALSSFTFSVLSDGHTLFSLTGNVTLVYDPRVGHNVVATDIGAASSVLNGFTQVTPVNSPTAIAFVWDATDIDLALGTIGAGQSRVLTYTTTATTLTRSFGVGTCGLVAFSEFGDPIGRGGSIPPPATQTLSVAAIAEGADPCAGGQSTGLNLQRPALFTYPVPTFDNGVVSVFTGSTVPEPATWAMLITGFGLAGTAQRRRRTVAA